MTRARKPTPKDATRAVLYVRVSTEEQSLGPEAQRAAAERWCAARGVTLVAVFSDIGVSGGAPFGDCPGLVDATGALADLNAGILLVAKRDRLARDVMKAAMMEALVARSGATIQSAAGEGEGDDPASKLMRTMIDAFAEYERAVIKARTKAGLAVKKRRGEYTGTAPYGTRVGADGVHLEPETVEEGVREQARVLRSAGLSFRAIAAELERTGARPRLGGEWMPMQIARMVA